MTTFIIFIPSKEGRNLNRSLKFRTFFDVFPVIILDIQFTGTFLKSLNGFIFPEKINVLTTENNVNLTDIPAL